jgi:REP-associated tyrosine transposase
VRACALRILSAAKKRHPLSNPSFQSSSFGTHLSSKLCFVKVRPAMRSRYRIHESDKAHFITATIIEWLPVFTTAACCDIIVRSLEHCRQHKGLKVHAWVILDNHIHAILAAPDLTGTLRDLKSFTAKQILDQLKAEGREWLLNQLRYYRAAHKANEYQLWQEGSHPQAIFSDEMMQQKLDYIHNNPVKRGMVASPEHWRYSSAHEWLAGAVPVLRCDPWR